MTQTLALLLDGYRELNSKRLFWIVLAISGLVVAIFAALGLDAGRVTIVGIHLPPIFGSLDFLTPALLYKLLFATFGVQLWLSWISVGLAIVSTAGIFPDFLAGGSVDLYLSKPISRVRLFATKYVTGLLFVGLQVTAFSTACFLVLGLRAQAWMPSVFLAIPAVVVMFSYLFAVCTLFGVLTRSTVAAMLLTLLFWFLVWCAQVTEAGLLQTRLKVQSEATELDARIASVEQQLAAPPTTGPTSAPTTRRAGHGGGDGSMFSMFARMLAPAEPTTHDGLVARLDNYRRERAGLYLNGVTIAHNIAYAVIVPLPKTSATVDLAARRIRRDVNLPGLGGDDENDVYADPPPGGDRRGLRFAGNRAAGRKAALAISRRSTGFVVGTSLAFEAAVLVLAAWRFGSRDY